MHRLHCSLIVAGALLLATTNAQAKTVAVGAGANGRTVTLRHGDTLRIKLTEVRDGGFVWRTLSRPARSVLATLSSTYVAPHLPPGSVGGQGTRVARYRAAGAGTTHIRLGYFGPSSKTRPAKRFTLTVVVA